MSAADLPSRTDEALALVRVIAAYRNDAETAGGRSNDRNALCVENLISSARSIVGDPGYMKAPGS